MRADKAYASRNSRAYLRRGIRCTTPGKAAQAGNRRKRGSHGGRPAEVRPRGLQSSARGRVRDQSSQEAPAVATRYGKLAVRYEATVPVVAINEWL
ncbi:transposase [Streptomyces ambofaciens ATCC 23877]|uniref:Transposase n=1 Tax=Streptomyces ambofaciens (strain ATCC 23877 / 3486 / DSM 40053 / JCM 4204 / NBRC 12836 / NRRL B-2516) TaxID=278992 RepID=A0A0K2B5Q1_STRA7|nr:transposase [Streptomyces ambofaciens ATCC 23877]